MRKLYCNYTNEESIDRAVNRLRKALRKGDIIVSGPIPKNYYLRFVNLVSMIARRVLKGITHSCIYLGNDRILDIDFKLVRSGTEVFESTLRDFIKFRMDYAGGVMIYVVKPKHYTKYHREAVVSESIHSFINQREKLSHSYLGSVLLGFRYLFLKNKKYKEDMTFRKDWTCSHMVAYLMKHAGARIGKRASYTYVPSMFLRSKHFVTKSKFTLQ